MDLGDGEGGRNMLGAEGDAEDEVGKESCQGVHAQLETV